MGAQRTFKSFVDLTAVNRVTLQVDADQIVGLIGLNGAGKTRFVLKQAEDGSYLHQALH
ncbi:MAG: hypothetical protein PVI09_20985 [Anaerolineae bacterium]|jgi:ABC-type branched-subunit amino acid transport system ATPase component